MGAKKLNAFARMMIETNDRVQLPSRIIDPRNVKHKLHNYVVDYMTRLHELRFSKHELSMQTQLTEKLLNVLWMIDGYHKNFVDASNVSKIPECFMYGTPFRVLSHYGITKKSPSIKEGKF